MSISEISCRLTHNIFVRIAESSFKFLFLPSNFRLAKPGLGSRGLYSVDFAREPPGSERCSIQMYLQEKVWLEIWVILCNLLVQKPLVTPLYVYKLLSSHTGLYLMHLSLIDLPLLFHKYLKSHASQTVLY